MSKFDKHRISVKEMDNVVIDKDVSELQPGSYVGELCLDDEFISWFLQGESKMFFPSQVIRCDKSNGWKLELQGGKPVYLS